MLWPLGTVFTFPLRVMTWLLCLALFALVIVPLFHVELADRWLAPEILGSP